MNLDPRNDPRHLELARAILRGQSYEPHDISIGKMLWFVLDSAGADTWIGAEEIKLRFVGSREVHRYFLDLAPGVVWDLLGRLGVARIEGPTVGVLRGAGARVWWHVRSTHDMLVWIVPTPDEIVIHTRPIGGAGECETGPIPDSGPFALPAVEPPVFPDRPSAPEFAELSEPLSCPHCGKFSSRYRRLSGGWFVCRSCGRSFQPPQGRQRS
jgi:rubredoxin